MVNYVQTIEVKNKKIGIIIFTGSFATFIIDGKNVTYQIGDFIALKSNNNGFVGCKIKDFTNKSVIFSGNDGRNYRRTYNKFVEQNVINSQKIA